MTWNRPEPPREFGFGIVCKNMHHRSPPPAATRIGRDNRGSRHSASPHPDSDRLWRRAAPLALRYACSVGGDRKRGHRLVLTAAGRIDADVELYRRVQIL